MQLQNQNDSPTSPQPSSVRVSLGLTSAPKDLAAWVVRLRDAEIPVRAETAEALEVMREHEDNVDANLIGEMIAGDPLMTLKVLAFAAKNRPSCVLTQPETVTSTLVLVGISPFFRFFGPQPTLEDCLGDRPEALLGLNQVLQRANRAADFALAFGVHRLDPDAAVIHQAALLNDFAELLLWCHAPDLALCIQRAQRSDGTLRSKVAQQQFLNVGLAELQHALMLEWRLPDFLIQVSDSQQAHRPSVQCANLGIRIARHSALGWDNPAIPDDVSDVARLLNISSQAAMNLLREIDR